MCPKHHWYRAFISHTSWGQHPTVQSIFHSPSSEIDFQLNTDISINQELRMALCASFYWILDSVFSLLLDRKWPLWKEQARRVQTRKASFLVMFIHDIPVWAAFVGTSPWHRDVGFFIHIKNGFEKKLPFMKHFNGQMVTLRESSGLRSLSSEVKQKYSMEWLSLP